MTLFRALFVLALTLAASTASAQSIGTFRWRTAPYCNVMNVTVTQVGNFYRLEGFDQQCGGNPNQPLWGIGVPQANGTITFGFSQVMLPGVVKPVAIRASISLSNNLSGSWEDNAGSSGTFEFNPTCTVNCGGPRTLPVVFDHPATPDAAVIDALKAEVAALRRTVEALAIRKDD
jgi:hypothetical protein